VFPTQFFELTNLKTLTLNSAGLSELPDFSSLSSLAELRLVKNKFVAIPAAIFRVTSLVELDMGNNMIQVLPDELAHMPRLCELYLYVNYIHEIPDAFKALTSLTVLNLAHNKLVTLPSRVLPFLKQLSQLKVSGNQLTSIPREIGELDMLSDLNVSRNKLTSLPDELGRLAQLRWLNVKENALTQLPESLSALQQLEELLVSNNELDTLPARFAHVRLLLANNNKITHLDDNTCLDSVIELCLSENRMRALPASLNSMRNLQKLSITMNQLESLPDNISELRKLTQLDAKNNQMRSLPESIGALKLCVLDVGHNLLEALPDSIWNSSRIWYVHCAGNPLTQLPPVNPASPPYMADLFLGGCKLGDRVFDDFQAIRTMRTIDIGYNLLTEIRPSIQKMQNLQILFLSGNQLTSLPDELTRLKFLRELHLANNRLTTLPSSLPKLRSLRTIDLSHNLLTDVSAVLSLEALEWLDISNNRQLKFSPASLSMLRSLQEFYADNVATDSDLPYELSHGVKERGERFCVSWADMMGRRDGMEDCTVFRGSLGPERNIDLFCVLDGHGGRRVATAAGSDLLLEIPRRLLALPDTASADDVVRQTFRDIHARIGDAEIGVMEGATAVAVLFVANRLLVANVGDTRVVLSRAGSAVRLSYDHKPDLPEEEERIRALGGFVGDDQRVNAVLAVSRAFGDFALDPFVLCDPYISDTQLTDADEFLIIACDGVWDVLSDQQAVDLVRTCDPTKAATVLRDYAYMYGSMDNISVVVLKLDQANNNA
jgi:adenylate cyclase